MTKSWLVGAALVSASLLGWAFTMRAAPAPVGKDMERWEYGELSFERITGAQWTSARTKLKGEWWDNLAKQLKAPAGPENRWDPRYKVLVMDQLGKDGWEVVQYNQTTGAFASETWLFKRRVR